jgi:hypothetical protein
MRRFAEDLYRYFATFQGWLWVALGTLLCGVLIPPTLLVARVWPAPASSWRTTSPGSIRWC